MTRNEVRITLREALVDIKNAIDRLGSCSRQYKCFNGDEIDWLYYAMEHANDAAAAVKYRLLEHMEDEDARQ